MEEGFATIDEAFMQADELKKFVTFRLEDQFFGVDVLQVEDIIKLHGITPIPLASPEIKGSLNLRGRIVTVIDLRTNLGLTSVEKLEDSMNIVVEHNGDLYSFIVDGVGDVLNIDTNKFEKNFGTLDKRWRDICSGIYRLEDKLLLIMNPIKLLTALEKRCGVDVPEMIGD